MNKNNVNNKSLCYYINNINKYKCLPKKEIREIFIKKIKEGDNELFKEKIITSNLRLVVNIAKKYRDATPYLNFVDLISAGNLGLFKAYEKYDINKNKEFSTYATFWIRHYISREISDNKHLVRKPTRLVESYNKFIKQRNEAEKRYGKKLSVVELAREINVPEKDVCCLDEISKTDTIIPDDELLNGDCEIKVNVNWLIKDLNKIIEKESFRNKTIIRMKLGFTSHGNFTNPYTSTEIAKKVNMSIEGVRQIALRLTNKIKRRLKLEQNW